jgi:branched-chain amino acid aminotransferase
MKATETIWHNGAFKPWHEATTHVLSHALHYGSSVFEGIRVYDKQGTPVGFRMREHLKRMYDSARVYRIVIPYDFDTLYEACCGVVTRNGLASAYLRPIAWRGYGSIGVAAGPNVPVDVAIAAIQWGAYLGEEAREKGARVCVSSWNRVAPNTIPAGAKAGGNYLSSFLIAAEARERGFTEGIALGADGLVSEGSGDNVFVIRDNRIVTPPVAASILGGITRDSAIQLARKLGYEVVEQVVSREQLYAADEIFLTGTAVEVTPVRRVDHMRIGEGTRGPITQRIQKAFFGLFDGSTPDERGWLEPLQAG